MDPGQSKQTDSAAPRRAKACPQCSAWTFANAPACPKCGHRFSTGLDAAQLAALHEPLTEQNIHKTRMFTLPPLMLRRVPDAESETPVVTEEEVALGARRLKARERARRILGLILGAVLVLLMGALWWWLQGKF